MRRSAATRVDRSAAADLILAIDQGTTSTRALAFDREGAVRGWDRRPVDQEYPRPGWVDQSADQLWQSTIVAAREALARAGAGENRVAAIGICNQTETSILWERESGRPLRPAMGWQSRQSAPVAEDLYRRGVSETYRRLTGLVPDPCFSATKLAWWLDDDPALRRSAENGDVLFGTVDSWLLWNLSGRRHHLTDVSNASRTMLFDIRTLDWSGTLLGDLAIPRAMLPAVRPSSGLLCETDAELFGAAVPVAGAAGDQQAALFGQHGFEPGNVKCTYGTGAFMLMHTGSTPPVSRHRLLSTIAWGLDGRVEYALEGGVWVAGAAVDWLRDGLGLIADAGDVEPLAASVPDSGGVVLVPAFVGLGAPLWDQSARGTITGLTRGTTAAHLARATLEAIALQTRDVFEAMVSDTGTTIRDLRVDGGASANDLLMQIQADVLGVPVVRAPLVETSALGAAFLAGLGVGFWRDRQELRALATSGRQFEPQMAPSERDRLTERWRRAVDRSRDWSR